ncbi:hypothetical protein ACGFNU_44100 [Spirillospora sp. NPDC048911]
MGEWECVVVEVLEGGGVFAVVADVGEQEEVEVELALGGEDEGRG